MDPQEVKRKMEFKELKVLCERISKAWREWNTHDDSFISDELIKSLHELDNLFPGTKAGGT